MRCALMPHADVAHCRRRSYMARQPLATCRARRFADRPHGAAANSSTHQGWQAGCAWVSDAGSVPCWRAPASGPWPCSGLSIPEGDVCHVYLLHPPGGVVGGDSTRYRCAAGAGRTGPGHHAGCDQVLPQRRRRVRGRPSVSCRTPAQPWNGCRRRTSFSRAPRSSWIPGSTCRVMRGWRCGRSSVWAGR